GRGRRAANDCSDLAALRQAIDALDRALVGLFAERERYIRRAAELKRDNGLPARIPDRVEEVIARVRRAAEASGADPDLLETVWRAVIEHAIALEERALSQ
ncbi:MAG: chorismate mutase, partial [Rubrimonas sp.]